MNRIFRIVWSHVLNAWVAVSENAKGRGKHSSKRKVIIAALALSVAPLAQAAPTGGQVASGSASISQSGSSTNIQQTTQNLSLNWQSFNVASSETVNFLQPSATAIAVNRIFDTNGSQILGHLNANGQVWLINPNGVFFGQGAQVNVGGLVASTLDFNDSSLGNSRVSFSGTSTGSVVNQGTINAANGGYVALLGNHVSNQGTIIAQLGTVALGAGSAATLTFIGSSLVHMQVDQSTLDNLAENGGLIQADGGQILMTAGAQNAVLASVVNNTGILEASTANNQNGTIILTGGMLAGTVNAGGTVDVSSAAANGGQIIATANKVLIADNATLNATGATGGGTINIGGGWQGSGNIAQATTDYVSPTATLNTSATNSGNGGLISVWSNVASVNSSTRAYGTLLAQGGVNGGNGGNIETSGHLLDVVGITVKTSAPNGNVGEWLLDPADITISTGGDANYTDLSSTYTPTSGSATSTVNTGTLDAALTAGNNIIITTTNTGTAGVGTGNITVSNPIASTGTTAGSLSLIAGAGITLNAGITLSGTGSALLLKAGSDIIQASTAAVTTNNGAVTYWANDNATGGAIWLKGTGSAGASITTNGGNITLSGGTSVATGYAQGDATNSNGVTLDTATLNSGGGNIVIRGKGATTTAVTYLTSESASSGNNDGIRLYSGNTINSGTGTIDIEGVAVGTGSGASNGIETNGAGYSKILSAATNTTAITLFGDASSGTNSGNAWGTFLWGGNTFGIVIAATGTGGGISLNGKGDNYATGAGGTHLEPNAFVLAASGPISITGTAGTLSNYADVDINSTIGFISSLPGGFGISSPVTASSSNISITADSLSANHIFGGGALTGSAVQSSGTLTIAPRTTGKAMAVQTSAPTAGIDWINPASMFGSSGLFKTGFSSLVFGSSTTGNITLDNYTFDNPTTLNTSGNAILGAISIANNALTVNMTGSGTITQTGAVAVSQLDLNGSTSAATLNTTSNAIGTLAANVASLSLVDNIALNIGTVGTMNGVTATGAINISTRTGNLTVTQNVATTDTTSSALVLDAGTLDLVGTTVDNILFSGSGGVSVGTGGRAILYTGSISGSTGVLGLVGSGSGNFRYDSKVGTNNFTAALGTSGDFAVYREQPTLTITANSPTAITYGSAVPTYTSLVTGEVNGDSSAQALSTQATVTAGGAVSTSGNLTATTHTLTASGAAGQLGYALSYATGSLVVNKLTLTGAAIAGVTPTYGTTAAAGAVTFGNVVGSDLVNSAASINSPTYSTSNNLNAGSYTQTASTTITNTDAGNYSFAGFTSTANYTVGKLALTGAAIAGVTTTYGTPAAAGAVTFGNVVGSDLVNSAASITSPTYSAGGNLNAASYKQTASTTLTNTDAGNYNFAGFTSAANYNVGRLSLTVGGLSGVNKVYDANSVANLTGTASVNALSNDNVVVTGFGNGAFGNQNVGNGKAVTVTGNTLSGADAGNYNVVQPTGVSANITAAPLVITANSDAKILTQADNTAGYNGVSYSGLVGGEMPAVVAAGTITRTGMGASSGINDAAGNYTGVLVPGGYSSGNYNITYANGNYTIVPADQLLVKVTNTSTTYGTAPVFSITSAQYLNGSNVLTTLTQSSANGNTSTWADTAGGSTTFTLVPSAASSSTSGNYVVGNYAITGGNTSIVGGNFTALNFVGNLAVTQQALTANASNVSKVYDSTTSMTGVTLGLAGLTTNDLVTVGGTGAFSTKNVGSGLGYSISNMALSGADAANYYLSGGTSFSGSNGVITPASLTISGITASNKVYNASTAATVSTAGAVYAGLFGGDSVTVAATGVFDNQNAGTGKAVSLTSNYSGLDATNYIITNQASTTADITPAPLYVAATTVSNKIYDGTTIAKLTGGVLSGTVYSGDNVTLATQAGSFASKNVSSGITVTATDSLGGTSAGNYILIEPAGLAANITPATLTVTGTTAANKVYDGTTIATLTGGLLSGVYLGDTVTLATQAGSFASKNVGSGIAVTATDSLGGTSSGNYTLIEPTGLAANILPLPQATGSTLLNEAQAVSTQLISAVLPMQENSQPQSLSISPTITINQVSSSDATPNDASSSGGTGSANNAEVNVKMTIGEMGPTLKIENGGIKLPENIASVQLEQNNTEPDSAPGLPQL